MNNDVDRRIIKSVTGRDHLKELLAEINVELRSCYDSLNEKALDILRYGFEQALISSTPLALAALNFEQFVKHADVLREQLRRQAVMGLEIEQPELLQNVKKYIEQRIEDQISRLLVSGAKLFAAYEIAIESADATRKTDDPRNVW